MRVLVTGHLGYIGTVLTPMLLQEGYEVVGYDSDIYRESTFGEGIVEVPTIYKDIRDAEFRDIEGFDAVLHLAGLSNDPLGELDPRVTMQINFEASVRLAELAREAGVPRFVFSSSCSNYGAGGEAMRTEESAFCPVTPYAQSKVLAEREIALLANERFSPIFLRSATAYGVSPRIRFDLVVNNLTAWAFTTGKVHLKSDGSAWRPLVHVEDIARAFIAALKTDRHLVHNQAFNIGRTESNYRIREIACMVKNVVPDSEVRFAEGASPDTRCYRVDCSKAERQLKEFNPRWTPEQGVAQCYSAYKKIGLTLEDFEGARFQRVAHIGRLRERGILTDDLRLVPGSRNDSVDSPTPRRASVPADAEDETGKISKVFKNRCASAACRSCAYEGLLPVLDLGLMPPSDGLLEQNQLSGLEARFPLEVAFCPECSLVQILETVPPASLFGDGYLYFSSFSKALLDHSRANALSLLKKRGLNNESLVVELASNDGYLLKNFLEFGIPVLGIDPAPRQVEAARQNGVPTLQAFFGREVAQQLCKEDKRADVIIANNVLAHVADTHGFIDGIKLLLKPEGVAVIEVPYVRDLVDKQEFDTIYHEHLCYFSVTALDCLFRRHQLYLKDVERLPIHGGSLRLYITHSDQPSKAVLQMLEDERVAGVDTYKYYKDFSQRVRKIQNDLRELVLTLAAQGKRIAAYGAAAKGTIMLNASGLNNQTLGYVVDRNTHKHGKYMPGIRLPVCPVEKLLEDIPDYLVLLPWNFADEILEQQSEYRHRGGKFIIPIPDVRVA